MVSLELFSPASLCDCVCVCVCILSIYTYECVCVQTVFAIPYPIFSESNQIIDTYYLYICYTYIIKKCVVVNLYMLDQ